MTDITKCEGKECAMKETCWRYKAPKGYYQSYFTESPINKETKECEYYWVVGGKHFKGDKKK